MKDIIHVKNFRKSYGGRTVHQDVNFSVYEGECLGLIGGSGAGKSVLLRSLIGLERPDSGSIKIFGQEITNRTEDQMASVRKDVAYVFQNGALFDSLDVYENLAYPLRNHFSMTEVEITEKIRLRLEEFGLSGSERTYPGNLSGGMQKRVGLARSMMMSPKVVLYDEPTAGLDPHNTKRIQEIILGMKDKGVTSILVTHDMPTAQRVCDRMIILRNGKAYEDKDLVQKFSDGEAL